MSIRVNPGITNQYQVKNNTPARKAATASFNVSNQTPAHSAPNQKLSFGKLGDFIKKLLPEPVPPEQQLKNLINDFEDTIRRQKIHKATQSPRANDAVISRVLGETKDIRTPEQDKQLKRIAKENKWIGYTLNQLKDHINLKLD